MNQTVIAVTAAVALLALVLFAGVLTRRRPRKLNQQYYSDKWKTLYRHCGEKATWPLAVIDADKLLDDALRRLHYKGKTMGERLVSAQHSIKNNDEVWYAHKLRNRLVHESDVKISERDVKDALVGIRGALKDLGAIK